MINYQQKNIKQFTKSDTIYISRFEINFTAKYYCGFLELLKNNVVKGEILEHDDQEMRGVIIKAKVENCYLLDKDYDEHWFDKDGKLKKVIK